MVLAERDPMIGVGRALPHNGFSALQPWKTNKAIGRGTEPQAGTNSFHAGSYHALNQNTDR